MGDQLELALPPDVVGVVLLNHAPDDTLVARYAERHFGVPSPRRRVAEALRLLAVELDDQADQLDIESDTR